MLNEAVSEELKEGVWLKAIPGFSRVVLQAVSKVVSKLKCETRSQVKGVLLKERGKERSQGIGR